MTISVTATTTYLAYKPELRTNNKATTVASKGEVDENVKTSSDSQSTEISKTDTDYAIAVQNTKSLTGSQQIDSMPKKESGGNGSDNRSDTKSQTTEKQPSGQEKLSDEEEAQVQELKKRDAEVKTHEQAHLAAGGSYVRGGISYNYQTGPDGMKYATGGEVQIDTSPVKGDPEATIMKAQVVRAAALAPAEPSSQDKAVAAQASKMMQSAQAELMDKKTVDSKKTDENRSMNKTTSSAEKSDGNTFFQNIYSANEPDKISASEQINLVA